jgi:hypothetical protein
MPVLNCKATVGVEARVVRGVHSISSGAGSTRREHGVVGNTTVRRHTGLR